LQQYFKSIEQVATSQGFGQALPSEEFVLKKRDSVLEKLDSPKSPTSKTFLAPLKPALTRQITPELVPDSMHERVEQEKAPALDGLETKELPLQPMHERVDSAQLRDS
jgi:glucosamine-6-phosphate deaminase